MTSITNIKHDTTKGTSRLEFIISGENINYIIINTLRRIILTDIPIYAFTDFTFNKNTSVFHNNFLKNQIKNIPVWGIDNKLEYYDNSLMKQQIKEEDEIENLEDDIDLSVEKKVNSNSLEQLTMYVDYENKSNEIYSVTTNNAKFYFAQKQIDNPYHVPVQLVKLQPKQSINFSVITSIGIEKINSIYSPVSICSYEELDEHKFHFILESRGQLNEKKILKLAVLNLIKKLEHILSQIPDNDKNEGDIEINDEDHTIGNLLSYGLQNNKNVKSSSYHMPHPLEKRVIISYKLTSGKIKAILKKCVDDFIDIYNDISKKIDKN
jgi:DNA-directed RNA polymerase subunit L